MYERLIGIYTSEELEKLSKSKILLVGVGGVGSFCFEVLIRSGIKNITIIDFDTYENSNLNRQLHANINTIGKKKVDVLRDYAKSINKDIVVNIKDLYLNKDTIIDYKEYDYIIDACDSVDAKCLLVINAKKCNIRCISCLGVGNRCEPDKISVTSLKKVNNDPLAKKFRHTLKDNNFNEDVLVVASSEIPKKIHPVGSFIGVSSYAGITLATKVIKDIIND